MAKSGLLNVPVMGIAASPWSLAQLRERASDSIRQTGKIDDRKALKQLLAQLRYVQGNYNDPATFKALKLLLGEARRPTHYLATAEAYPRGIERRIAGGLDPAVGSVASIFASRWDVPFKDKVPQALRNDLGIAIVKRTYKAYREQLVSKRWETLATAGARSQRLLWASTGTKDPAAPDTLYITALAAPNTINTMPEKSQRGGAAP